MHCDADGQATAERKLAPSIVVGDGDPGDAGLNVSSAPPETPVHCSGVVAGTTHDTWTAAPSAARVAEPGEPGSKSITSPLFPIPAQAEVNQQATPVSATPLSIGADVAPPGDAGSNITS